MAGGAAILSTYDEVLKTFYLPAIQEQLNHETFLADRIEVNEEDVSGKNATIEMHYGRSTGTGEGLTMVLCRLPGIRNTRPLRCPCVISTVGYRLVDLQSLQQETRKVPMPEW